MPVVSLRAFDDGEVTEGDEVVFTLDRDIGASFPLSVKVAVTQTGDVLVAAAPRTEIAQFDAGSTMVALRLATHDDTLEEERGTVQASVSADSDDGYVPHASQGTATIAVVDDDAPPTIEVADAVQLEGDGALDFVVSLN